MRKETAMSTLLFVGSLTLTLFVAWLAARAAQNRAIDEMPTTFRLLPPTPDFNDGWDWYDYSPEAAPEGLIVEVIDEAALGPRG